MRQTRSPGRTRRGLWLALLMLLTAAGLFHLRRAESLRCAETSAAPTAEPTLSPREQFDRLDEVRGQLPEYTRAYREAHPDADVYVTGWVIQNGAVEVYCGGADVLELAASGAYPPEARLLHAPDPLDARLDAPIPRPPEASFTGMPGVTVSLSPADYTERPEALTLAIRNGRSTPLSYSFSSMTFEKYVADGWKPVEGHYGWIGDGEPDLAPDCERTLAVPIRHITPLGQGLYRANGGFLRAKDGPSYSVSLEFTVGGSSGEMAPWEPYYTGDPAALTALAWEKPWLPDDDPEAPEPNPDREQARAAMTALGVSRLSDPDFAGEYVNVSGSLTLMLVSPTAERVRELAERSKTGFWVLEAKHSLAQLNQAAAEARDALTGWIALHPEAGVVLRSAEYQTARNRVVLRLDAVHPDRLSSVPLPDCVLLELNVLSDAQAAEPLPHPPLTVWTVTEGVTVSAERADYPVGVETVNLLLDNGSENQLIYGLDYALEKWIDGEWRNVSGSLSFPAVGCIAEPYQRKTLPIEVGVCPVPLGAGLYRIVGSSFHQSPPGGADASGEANVRYPRCTVEFAVSARAERDGAA